MIFNVLTNILLVFNRSAILIYQDKFGVVRFVYPQVSWEVTRDVTGEQSVLITNTLAALDVLAKRDTQ